MTHSVTITNTSNWDTDTWLVGKPIDAVDADPTVLRRGESVTLSYGPGTGVEIEAATDDDAVGGYRGPVRVRARKRSESAESLGEQRVRVDFVPDGPLAGLVAELKEDFADLIDRVAALGGEDAPGEVKRIRALAMTALEEGAMWAVKAATA